MMLGQRDEIVLQMLRERGSVTVADIAQYCNCSIMTARRDLNRLAEQGLIRRTHGGAVLKADPSRPSPRLDDLSEAGNWLLHRSDALIVTPLDTLGVRRLTARIQQAGKPIVAESVTLPGANTLVTVDDYAAGLSVGDWTGDYAQAHLPPSLTVLDVAFSQPNTAARSRGFLDGLRRSCAADLQVLRLGGHKTVREAVAKVVGAALDVHPQIDIIFCCNDSSALGAVAALKDRGLDDDRPMIVSVGLGGKLGKDMLAAPGPYKAAAAMFPELVGPACIDAAVCAYHGCALPDRLVTPTVVLTERTITEYYDRDAVLGDWVLNESSARRLRLENRGLSLLAHCQGRTKPASIGYIKVFSGLDWYRTLAATMLTRSRELGIRLEVIDASLDLDEERDRLNRDIGQAAAACVGDRETIMVDAGPSTYYLALALRGHQGITVISNALRVLNALADQPNMTLIACGGVVRGENQAASGPAAERCLQDLRADKAFLTGTGLSLDFGLSTTEAHEVGVKQAMARAATQVYGLVEHTAIGHESLVKVLSLDRIHSLVTDANLPIADRLAFTQRGVSVVVAESGRMNPALHANTVAQASHS